MGHNSVKKQSEKSDALEHLHEVIQLNSKSIRLMKYQHDSSVHENLARISKKKKRPLFALSLVKSFYHTC